MVGVALSNRTESNRLQEDYDHSDLSQAKDSTVSGNPWPSHHQEGPGDPAGPGEIDDYIIYPAMFGA